MSFDLNSKELEGLNVLSWEEGSESLRAQCHYKNSRATNHPPPQLVVKDVLTN